MKKLIALIFFYMHLTNSMWDPRLDDDKNLREIYYFLEESQKELKPLSSKKNYVDLEKSAVAVKLIELYKQSCLSADKAKEPTPQEISDWTLTLLTEVKNADERAKRD